MKCFSVGKSYFNEINTETFAGMWERVNCSDIIPMAGKKNQNGKFEAVCFYLFFLKYIDFSGLRTLSRYSFEYLKMNL